MVVVVGWSPILPRTLAHISLSLSTSRADNWCREFWWDTWYSWIFIGGPPGRYIVGSFLGFRLLRRERGPEGDNFPGSIIELPHLRMALLLLLSGFFVVLSVVRSESSSMCKLLTIPLKLGPSDFYVSQRLTWANNARNFESARRQEALYLHTKRWTG